MSLVIQRRRSASKSSPFNADKQLSDLFFSKKRLATVNIPAVFSLISSNGIEPYKLVTSRLQNPCISFSVLFIFND